MSIIRTLTIPRKPDFCIGDPDAPYLRRWWVIPRNKYFNIYLHNILRSDDDRALHDHPWWNLSVVLKGGYFEHMPAPENSVFKQVMKWRGRGSIVFRKAKSSHRLELDSVPCYYHGGVNATDEQAIDCEEYEYKPCWSLFITGPKIREWGFHCPKGWTHWREFIGVKEGEAKGSERGPGCGED